MNQIRLLPPHAIALIAAGEVIDRPSSMVKELLENSMDAGATHIHIWIEDGGKSLIQVQDNGQGIKPQDLPLAFAHHATSKLDPEKVDQIRHFGFRGEALASMAAVAHLEISSLHQSETQGYKLLSSYGHMGDLVPCAQAQGTTVTVKNLFALLPARLKFLKTKTSEQQSIWDIVQKQALSHPLIAFQLYIDSKQVLNLQAAQDEQDRIRQIFGPNFAQDLKRAYLKIDDYEVLGFFSLPTYAQRSGKSLTSFLWGRYFHDRSWAPYIRALYGDLLPAGFYPQVFLFIKAPWDSFDVNVHPQKLEIRFTQEREIKALIAQAWDQVKADLGFKVSTWQSRYAPPPKHWADQPIPSDQKSLLQDSAQVSLAYQAENTKIKEQETQDYGVLGQAFAHIFDNYILSRSHDALIIIDQHAAHERLVYEQLKTSYDQKRIETQALLVPEIITLDAFSYNKMLEFQEDLAALGFVYESFGDRDLIIREVPATLKNVDVQALIQDMLSCLQDAKPGQIIKDKLYEVFARQACHGSIRSGRILHMAEAQSLIQQMEREEKSGHCNHGRPTYVRLELKDLEKIFHRT